MFDDICSVVRYQKYVVAEADTLHSCTGLIVVILPIVTGSSGHEDQGKGCSKDLKK